MLSLVWGGFPAKGNSMPEENKTENKTEEKKEVIDKKLFEEAIATRDAAKEKLRAYEEELNKIRSTESERAKKEAADAAAAEQAKLVEQGKYQDAIKNIENKYKNELSQKDQLVAKALVPAAIKAAASKVKNIVPEAIDDLPSLLSKNIQLDPNTYQIVVVGEDGKPLTDEKMQPVSVDTFVTSYVTKKPHFVKDGMPTGTGLKPGVGAGGQAFTVEQALVDPKILKAWEAADPEGCKAAFDLYNSPESIRERKAKGK